MHEQSENEAKTENKDDLILFVNKILGVEEKVEEEEEDEENKDPLKDSFAGQQDRFFKYLKDRRNC